ncbi:hypothetical protein TrRE_jg8468, partial [Triparma retinervis]
MDVLRSIENLLRDLSSFARHSPSNVSSIVKEASEYGVVQLRSLRAAHAKAVREAQGSSQGSSAPPSIQLLFSNQALLDPFLLSCTSTAPPGLVGIALNGINFLLTHKVVRKDAMEGVPQSDSCSPSMLQVKALQSFILLMNELDGEGGGEDVIGGVMGCVGLLMQPPRDAGKKGRGSSQASSNPTPPATSPMVASSAVATFTQLTSILFDRASEEVLNGESFVGNHDATGDSAGVQTTLEVLNRLCDMGEASPRAPSPPPGSSPPETTIKSAFKPLFTPANRRMAFELINMVLMANPDLFSTGAFAEVVRFRVCPLVTTTLLEEWHQGEEEESSQSNFTLLVKLLQLSSTLLLTYGATTLKGGECHILLTTLLHFVSCSTVGYANEDNNDDGFEFGDMANREWAKSARERNSSVDGSPPHHGDPPQPPPAEGKHHQHGQQVSHHRMRSDQKAAQDAPLPSAHVWRTSLALEILYNLAEQPELVRSLHSSLDSSISTTTRPSATILFQITESLKEFVTKGLRGERRIRAVVEAGWRKTGLVEGTGLGGGSEKTYNPNIFQSAQNHHYSGPSATPNQLDSNAQNVDSYPPSCGEGEALYLGLKTCFLLTSTVHSLSIPSLTSTCFRGLHEVIQHCAMWCSGAASLGADVMKSWEELFGAAVACGEEALKAESLETLCKFSLPNFKATSSIYISNFHASSLTSLFTLVHIHAASLSEGDWLVVLSTFEQLSYMPIASSALSDDSYDVAIALSSALSLLTEFTCCLGGASLASFARALTRLKGFDAGDFAPLRANPSAALGGQRDAQSSAGGEHTFGSRLMNIAGRAINNLQGKGGPEPSSKGRLHPGRLFGEDLRARALSRPETVEAGLSALQGILESQGQAIREAWPLVIATVGARPGSNTAFRCLRFIVDDFVEILGEEEMTCLLKCSKEFATSKADVNASLTAVGMIWTVSDHFRNMKMWGVVFGLLIDLSEDQRAEVRNCAVNTLFSCVVGNGREFGDGEEDGWPFIFEEVILGLLRRVEGQLEGAKDASGGEPADGVSGGGGAGFQVRVHHSRDSPRKQWAETYKICIQGLGRVLRQFCDSFKRTAWFPSAARRVLAVGEACAVGGVETEVSIAGVELVLLVVEVCCRGGVNRGGDNLKSEMKVVNGALTQLANDKVKGVNEDCWVLDRFMSIIVTIASRPSASPIAPKYSTSSQKSSLSLLQLISTSGRSSLAFEALRALGSRGLGAGGGGGG